MSFDTWIAKLDAMTPEEKLATITLDEVQFYDNVMVLSWSGVIGFGEYTIELSRETEIDEDGDKVTKSYTMQASSEGMDLHNDNKVFLRHLLNQFVEKVSLSDEQEREADWEERQKNRQQPPLVTCKFGYRGCVLDPGYIWETSPEWYAKLYKDTPYSEIGCPNCLDGEKYDDEDK